MIHRFRRSHRFLEGTKNTGPPTRSVICRRLSSDARRMTSRIRSRSLSIRVAQRTAFIGLPDLAAADVQGGQPTTQAAAGIDALEVAEVEDLARSLRRMADDGDLA